MDEISLEQNEDVNSFDAKDGVDTKDGVSEANEFLFINDIPDGNFSYTSETFDCAFCGKALLSRGILKTHIDRYHHQDGVFHHCFFCDKSFKTKNARNVHKFRNHKNQLE